jgi:hypothetical protein
VSPLVFLLKAAGQWWAKRINEFKKRGYEEYLLINIANEWVRRGDASFIPYFKD